MTPSFSRRDFLLAARAGLLGLFLADLRLDRALAAQMPVPVQGRITESGNELFSEPTFNAKKTHIFRHDEVVEIAGIVQGDKGYGNPFNSTWYRIGDEGFIYSGGVQPVETLHQKPVFDIPETGVLGEITVPFCDTKRDISRYADRSYRIYYSTTHWITDLLVNRDEKSFWYKIYDQQIKESLYVEVHEMRVVSSNELSLISAEVPEEEKRIYIDLATQSVTAFEGENPVFVTALLQWRQRNYNTTRRIPHVSQRTQYPHDQSGRWDRQYLSSARCALGVLLYRKRRCLARHILA